jgi:peptidyl-prolyl cis-trans isomerase C
MPHTELKVRKFFIILSMIITVGWAGSVSAQTSNDQVLATVGNQSVTEEDLQQMANAVPEKLRHLYLTPEGRQKSLDYIVNVYVISTEAEKEGLDKKPEVKRLIEFTKKDLLARMYLEKANKSLPEPSEQDTKTFYEQNKAQFSTPESIHLRHILVKTEKEAKDALDKIKKGQNFEDLAKKVSICPSKERGGDLDLLPRGSLLPEIENEGFKMEKGQIAGPIQTQFGFHVLMLEDKRPGEETSYDQARDYIMEQLKYQRQQENYEKVAESLRKQMNVKINLPAPAPPQPAAPLTPGAPATVPAAPATPGK